MPIIAESHPPALKPPRKTFPGAAPISARCANTHAVASTESARESSALNGPPDVRWRMMAAPYSPFQSSEGYCHSSPVRPPP